MPSLSAHYLPRPQAWFKALGFCGRIKHINETPIHKSKACVVLSGIDCDDEEPVVLKLMIDKESFEREKRARVDLDLDDMFVVPIIFASDECPERWEADAKNLAKKLTTKLDWPECPEYRHGIVMKQGERDLEVVALKERLGLSAIRDISRQVAHALVYLHSKNILHADIKPLASLSLLSSHITT